MPVRERHFKVVSYSEFHDFLRQKLPEYCNEKGRLLIPEAASALSLNKTTLYAAQKKGKISKMTAKIIALSSNGRISRSELEKFVA